MASSVSLHRQIIREFKPQTIQRCVFGTRIRPNDVPFGTDPNEYHWEANCEIIQRTIDRTNDVLCFIVFDDVRKVVGIAVIDTHADKSLWVNHNDYLAYNDTDDLYLKANSLAKKLR